MNGEWDVPIITEADPADKRLAIIVVSLDDNGEAVMDANVRDGVTRDDLVEWLAAAIGWAMNNEWLPTERTTTDEH